MSNLSKLSANKLKSLIQRRIRKAVIRYNLIEFSTDGDATDRLLFAFSGGRDSLVLLSLINSPRFPWHNKVLIQPIIVLGNFPGEEEKAEESKKYLIEHGYELVILRREIYSYAFGDNAPFNPCFICSRMRRKYLIEYAFKHNFNKIVLAHNKEDVIETFFLNLLYGGELSTMLPSLGILDGKLSLIRPLILASKAYINEYALQIGLPDLSFQCPYSDSSKRRIIGDFLREFERKLPGVRKNIFNALTNPKFDYLWKR